MYNCIELDLSENMLLKITDSDLERDTAGQVSLDHAGDDVDRRALRRENQTRDAALRLMQRRFSDLQR